MRVANVVLLIALLFTAGSALAQSGQGGYLGANPDKSLPTVAQDSAKPAPVHGSGQGGYLGQSAGANQPTASQEPMKPLPTHGSGQGGYLGIAPGASGR